MEKYSAIMEMYYGKRGDGQNIKPSEEYHERMEECSKIEEKLKARLKNDKEGLKLLDDLSWGYAGVEAAVAEYHYHEGFSFGLLIGTEAAGTH